MRLACVSLTLALGPILAGCASTPAAESPMPTQLESSVPSPSTGEATVGEVPMWREVGSFGGAGRTQHVLDVTFGTGQFVAVGIEYDAAGLPDTGPVPHEGRIWLSLTGEAWEALGNEATFDGATFSGLLDAADGSVLTFGRIDSDTGPSLEQGGEPAIWQSVDGRTWERIDVGLPRGLFVTATTQGANGYLLAAAREFEDPRQLWFSPDGLHWEPVYTAAGAYIQHIGAGDDGFAVLLAGAGDNRITMASADGRQWFDGDALPGFGPLAPLAGDWITSATTIQEPPVEIPMWFSSNGLAWSQGGSVADPGSWEGFGYARELSSAGGSVFLSAARIICCGSVSVPGGVWSSRDGHSWELTDIRPDGLILAAAEQGGAVVLAGYVGVNEGRATFWIGAQE